jgi:Prenyltransferase and squalene oxidase repeat
MNQLPEGQQPPDYDFAETIVVQEEEPRRQGYWYRMGGGSLTISIILHTVFVIIALLIIWQPTVTVIEPPPEFLPGGGGGGGGGEKLALKKQRTVTHAQPKLKMAASVTSTVTLPNVTSTMTPMPSLTSLQMGGGGLGSGEGGGRGTGKGTGVGSGIGDGWGPGAGRGFVALPPILRSRCSPAERAQKMRDNGGSEQCEVAVKRSLKWLKEKQNKDGSWGESHKGGMTGLALLAYLGHCETPESPVYGETVLKGLTYLMELAQKNKPPFDGIFSDKPSVISSTYEHGIAAYAMGEMYSFSKLGTKPIPGLRECFEKGAGIIIQKQTPNGGWGYKDGIGYDPYDGNDLSVTGWQFQALKAAKHTNLKIPGLPAAIKKVEKYLEGKQTPDGGFGNASRAQHYNQWNLTGAALLGLQTLGVGNAGAINKGIRWLVEDIEKEPRTWNSDCYLYTWYYDTQALFQKGGASWKVWNDQFQKEILENQNEDGSYKVESVGEVGAAGTGAAGGDKDVYRVCLATLMLEVYYRYLKVGDRGNDNTSGLMPLK